MVVSIDGERIFDEEGLEFSVGSYEREYIEKSVSGLNGVVSLDCGFRGREIKQKGGLRSVSRQGLCDKVEMINSYFDGGCHKLVIGDGREFDNVRIDAVRFGDERRSSGGYCMDYVITYKQLAI